MCRMDLSKNKLFKLRLKIKIIYQNKKRIITKKVFKKIVINNNKRMIK